MEGAGLTVTVSQFNIGDWVEIERDDTRGL
jgi:hypothetical protein